MTQRRFHHEAIYPNSRRQAILLADLAFHLCPSIPRRCLAVQQHAGKLDRIDSLAQRIGPFVGGDPLPFDCHVGCRKMPCSLETLRPLTVRGSLGSGAVCWPQPSSADRPNHCIKRVALSKSCAIISPGIGNGSFYGPALPISYN